MDIELIAKGLRMIADGLEAGSGIDDPRPVDPPAVDEQPAPDTQDIDSREEPIEYEAVQYATAQAIRTHGRDFVKAVLEGFDATSLSGVPASAYPALIEALGAPDE